MVYRDAEQAARERVEQQRDELRSRAERLTPELLDKLPAALRESLETLAPTLEAEPSDLDGWSELERTLAAYERAIARAVKLAPEIEQDFNRLPKAIPKAVEPREYFYFDIYDKGLEASRRTIHAEVNALLDECKLHDARPRYFDQVERPMLVDASGRLRGHPLRVQIGAQPRQAHNGQVLVWTLTCTMVTPVRDSAPAMTIEATLMGSLLALMRLRRDTHVGDPRIDRRLVIDALQPDADRLFSDAFRRDLLKMVELSQRPRLVVGDGLARMDWRVAQRAPSCIAVAAELLLGVRELPPVPMLRRPGTTAAATAGRG